MDRKGTLLELRLIMTRISGRWRTARSLSQSAWMAKRMAIPPGERFLVVSPHPDDDAIGCGGTILKLLEMGKVVRVCYLSLPMSGVELREQRKEELEKALQVLKVKDFSINQAEFPTSAKEVRGIIAREIQGWRPDCVLVPSPLENHDQHLMAFQAYLEHVKGMTDPPATLMYEVWGPLLPNLVVDIDKVMEGKLESIRAHASQVRMVDYCAMVAGLNQYRAYSNGAKGYAEAFLYLEAKDLIRAFG